MNKEIKTKRVLKYGTGAEIPFSAKYLCTQVETIETIKYDPTEDREEYKRNYSKAKGNALVWHYYEVQQ